MIEKLLGLLAGYVLCKGSDYLAQFMPQWLTPGSSGGGLPPAASAPPTSSIPSGATPVTVPPGAIPVIAPSAAPFPEQRPAGLPPFPGPGWTFAKTTNGVVQRAWALLPVLAMGQYKFEPSPDEPSKWLAYRKEPHAQGKTGVTVYTPKAATMAPPPPAPGPAPGAGPIVIPTSPDIVPASYQRQSPPLARVMKRGMKGADVAAWQRRLNIPADGDFGGKTELATKVFQKSHGLPQDGQVGPLTWAAAQQSAA